MKDLWLQLGYKEIKQLCFCTQTSLLEVLGNF